MNNMHNWDMGWGMPFFGLFFWLLVIIGFVSLIRWLINRKPTPPHYETPLDILKQRYARGEIDRDSYERMKKDIGYE